MIQTFIYTHTELLKAFFIANEYHMQLDNQSKVQSLGLRRTLTPHTSVIPGLSHTMPEIESIDDSSHQSGLSARQILKLKRRLNKEQREIDQAKAADTVVFNVLKNV